ncbi:hypothetical protein CcI156_19990 [Frankia sp. CcI156]|uniref:hypothetical protein n=1 Tax=unclassified Frankia TaxID=2632575 RepID=UPI0003D01448|nr:MULTISPECIES: hypothetical protein [unclassified Frankia]ETA00410.1 hypothetical protein CcI6DRAFT_04165 [Frankia sp. CcI6]KFB03040.1 hypothetical protein ALLO2DRAFT_04215 [Frankia sp. Allo2]OHV51115.1 hypothetical protein CgIS1_19595 [Frankia sp. CgIS1]ONH22921.1 hypothetical protein CcI156_19990 [Frankia sp. CcI156]
MNDELDCLDMDDKPYFQPPAVREEVKTAKSVLGLSTSEIEVELRSTGQRGGDWGHGGYTELVVDGTQMPPGMRVEVQNDYSMTRKFVIRFGGDGEIYLFHLLLAWAVKHLDLMYPHSAEEVKKDLKLQ